MTARRNYDEAIAAKICDMIAEGLSLDQIAARPGYPPRRTVRDWLSAHPDFEKKYEIARREWTDSLVDQIVEISDSVSGCTDNAQVQAARLACDNRKWIASKLLPTRYGDRVTQELVGANGADLIPRETDPSRIAMILLGILQRSRQRAADLEEPDDDPVLEPASAPRRLTPPPEVPAHTDAVASIPAKRPPPPGPRWASDAAGRLRHTSELQVVTK